MKVLNPAEWRLLERSQPTTAAASPYFIKYPCRTFIILLCGNTVSIDYKIQQL